MSGACNQTHFVASAATGRAMPSPARGQGAPPRSFSLLFELAVQRCATCLNEMRHSPLLSHSHPPRRARALSVAGEIPGLCGAAIKAIESLAGVLSSRAAGAQVRCRCKI